MGCWVCRNDLMYGSAGGYERGWYSVIYFVVLNLCGVVGCESDMVCAVMMCGGCQDRFRGV